ncbi:DUF3151 domain-containing protein [Corynebacterium qintianiae]|uniref:DUF3151 domain-containing protein n=1 Tax=Corynebacterium qintianiae TaxID=2709392 RepID=A0A7T0KNV7_9CORY|nr:DUF3151 domain-containing protein [Corynebacterium qintianiae]QPK83650.1 DUF3151 domain-containing protein [Corynebacterium qintianiae]
MKFDDMLAPTPVHLPEDPAQGMDLLDRDTALTNPESPAVWAARAAAELKDGDVLVAYAYARTGYHRSLDRLRANGWKGWGPVPASHTPNLGVLRAIALLALTSKAIGDTDEYDRCRQMLSDADPGSVDKLLG